MFNTRHTEIKKEEGGKYTLTIKNVTEEDIGGIECHARNFYGSVSSRTSLDVNGRIFFLQFFFFNSQKLFSQIILL